MQSNRTLLMGILNITPDSFSDGGEYFNNPHKAVNRAKQMMNEGADIIDIGGESTRPGSETVDVDEEIRRVLPIIRALRNEFGEKIKISVDTFKHEVANEAVKAGCSMVNTLGGFTCDQKLREVLKRYSCPIIIYHIRGIPKTMQSGEISYVDVVKEISNFFDNQIRIAQAHGISKERLILDPGIGFGKTVEQNITLIKQLQRFKKYNLPILIGISRKSHLGFLLKDELNSDEIPSPTERLEGALAETAVAVLNGANIVRTHDILETKKFLAVIDKFK